MKKPKSRGRSAGVRELSTLKASQRLNAENLKRFLFKLGSLLLIYSNFYYSYFDFHLSTGTPSPLSPFPYSVSRRGEFSRQARGTEGFPLETPHPSVGRIIKGGVWSYRGRKRGGLPSPSGYGEAPSAGYFGVGTVTNRIDGCTQY